MNCCNNCCPCAGTCQPVSSSLPAVDAAACATTGTQDTVNSLITSGSGIISAIFKQKGQSQATAVKAQVQLAQQQQNTIMVIVIGVIAVIGFLVFANGAKA